VRRSGLRLAFLHQLGFSFSRATRGHYYVLDSSMLERISAKNGMIAFVWTDDDPGEIFGQLVTLEHLTVGAFTGWRAKPLPGTFYRGPKPLHLLAAAGT